MTSQGATGTVPGWTVLLIAAACGLIAANLYFAQPPISPISGWAK